MIGFPKRIAEGIKRRVGDIFLKRKVDLSFRTLHGPAKVVLGDDEVGLISMVKNAEWFMSGFLKHHQSLGVKHTLIVDNGSTDKTVEIASGFPNVTVIQSLLPAKDVENLLRSRAAKTVFKGGWFLFADADELTGVPICKVNPIQRLVRYLNATDATAVIGHVIDFFDPKGRVGKDYAESILLSDTYSLDQIDDYDYFDTENVEFAYFLKRNSMIAAQIPLKAGGIRKEVFGEDPFLSRHSMVKNTRRAKPMPHPHAASDVRVADVTVLVGHYKFASNWRARDADSVSAGTWGHGEDKKRLESNKVNLIAAHPRKWQGVDELVDIGFLYVSERARKALAQDESNGEKP